MEQYKEELLLKWVHCTDEEESKLLELEIIELQDDSSERKVLDI